MRKATLLILVGCLWAKAQTTPTTQVWTKLGSTNGYQAHTIAQFDGSAWDSVRNLYCPWEEYLTATFSELNEYQGCYSYSDDRWEYLLQSSSFHSTHRPTPGHEWGVQTYLNNIMYWLTSSTQGIEPFWSIFAFDMPGLTSYDLPQFSQGGVLTRPWQGGAATLSTYMGADTTNGLLVFYPDTSLSATKVTVCSPSAMTCTQSTVAGGPAAVLAYSNMRFNPDDSRMYFYPGGGTALYSINAASPSGGWTNSGATATCTGVNCVFTSGSIGHPPPRGGAGLAYTTTDHLMLLVGGYSVGTFSATVTNGVAAIASTNAFAVGDTVEFTVLGTGGTGFSTLTNYCVLAAGLSTSQFELSATCGGSAITPTASSSATMAQNFQDIWSYSPSAGSGAGVWTQICGPCGVFGTSFPTWRFDLLKVGDRMQYDAADNVFQILDDQSVMWAYAYSAATGAYGRTCSTGCYGIKTPTSPVTGSLNRTAPPSYPSISNAQTGAIDLSIDTTGGAVYFASTQPGIPGTSGSCLFPVAYIGIIGGAFVPTGTQAAACSAIGNGSTNQPSGRPFHARIGTTDWEAHDKRNFAGSSADVKAIIQSYSGGSTGTWSGGDIGCFSNTCFSQSGQMPMNSPRGLINANGTLMALTVETTSLFNQLSGVFVANCSSIAPCTSLTGTTPLNIAASAYVTGAAFNTDPSGNLMTCWTEEVDNISSRYIMTTPPQLKCKYWNGSSMTTIGTGANAGSLNQSTASWARDPSVVYAGASGWYVAYTEQTRAGLPQLYVLACPLTGACALVGGAPLNLSGSDLAFHASLAADGTTIYVGWEDQTAVGQHAQGYINKWNGASWSSFKTAVAADTSLGSVSDFSVVVPSSGNVTAAWEEMSMGNAPQIFSASFSSNGVYLGTAVAGPAAQAGPTAHQ